MIYQKSYNIRIRGIIIADILIALALSTIFISLLTSVSIDSRKIFEISKEKSLLIKEFEDGKGTVSSKMYGNERMQIDFDITSTSSIQFIDNASNTLKFRKISLALGPVIKNDYLFDSIGIPLCSIDMMNKNVTGSFTDLYGDKVIRSATIVPILLPINPLLPLTDLEVRNGVAYIAVDSNISSDPDLLIVDIHEPQTAKILSFLNTGPGLVSIALVGKRIYAASPSIVGQLHIIKFDNLLTPILENRFKLPLPYATATAPLASSIFYKNNKIYLGTEKWDGDEFNIIDISNPLLPIKTGGLEISSKVNDIFVRNDRAYIANASLLQLIVADTFDSTNPIIINTFSPAGSLRQEGKTVSSFENSFNFSRTSGGYNVANEYEAFSWSDNPFYASSYNIMNQYVADISSGVYGIISDRGHVYLISRQANKEFQVFNQDLNVDEPFVYSLPITPQMMTCDGNRLYVLAHLSPYIYEISFE